MSLNEATIKYIGKSIAQIALTSSVKIFAVKGSSEAYTTMSLYSNAFEIYVGTEVVDERKISLYDVLMHEFYHIVLDHINVDKYKSYTPEQVNYAGDMEINSILGLDGADMDVLHPQKMNLPVGLTTAQYLKILFPKGKNTPESSLFKNQAHKCPRHNSNGESAQQKRIDDENRFTMPKSKSFGYGAKRRVENATVSEDGMKVVFRQGIFKKSSTDYLGDKEMVKFLEDAKIRSRVNFASGKQISSYTKLNRRDQYSGLIMPGTKKISSPLGNKQDYLPIIFIDVSGSTTRGLVNEAIQNVIKYAMNDFIIALYNDQLVGMFTPKDKFYMFNPDGLTNINKSLQQFKNLNPEMWDRISDIFVVTDGDDRSLTDAAKLAAESGKGLQAQFVNDRGYSSRVTNF